jgi:hypothetical protein
MQKVMSYVEYIPNVKNLSFASISEAVQTGIVSVKNELGQQPNTEPAEL